MATITTDKQLTAQISAQVATEIEQYLKEDLSNIFGTESNRLTKIKLQNIGKEANNILKKLRAKRTIIHTQLQRVVQPDAALLMAMQKHLIEYQSTLIKGYAFIQKTRQFITKETLEYVVLFDDGKDNSKVGQLTLEQLIPALSLAVQIDKKGNIISGLKIANTEYFSTLKNSSNTFLSSRDIENRIIEIYRTLMYSETGKSRRTRWEGQHLSAGFGFETAAEEALNNKSEFYDPQKSYKDRVNYLVSKYQQDTQVFWKGADLATQNGRYELKKISTITNYGNIAGLASSTAIETGLIMIKNICLSMGLKTKEAKALLENMFNAEYKNIAKTTAEKMTKMAFDEAEKILSQAIKK